MKKTIKKLLVGAVMTASIIGTTCVASAATTKTPYGTMKYYLGKRANNYIVASTTMSANSKRYSYIKTTLEVQDNNTGKTRRFIPAKLEYTPNCKVTATAISDKPYKGKFAAFSAHEVVGKTAFVKYCSTTY